MIAAEQLIALARARDPVIAGARALAAAGMTGDPHGRVRARRLVEAALADDAVLPGAADYLQAAVVLHDEQPGEAALFRVSARLEPELRAAEAGWRERYGAPAFGPVSRDAEHEGQSYRLGPAYPGLDGALYQVGDPAAGGVLTGPVVVVRAGSRVSVLPGWQVPDTAVSWVRERLPGGDGPLDWPPGAGVRLIREEQVLAFMLRAPWELDAAHAALRSYQWTAHSREQLFSAARAVFWRGHAVDATSVAGEAAGRYAWVPAWASDDLGGPDVPYLAQYLRRLARTPITPDVARAAISVLAAQLPAGPRAEPACQQHQHALMDLRPPPEPMPGPVARI